jgi:hypothetical protein
MPSLYLKSKHPDGAPTQSCVITGDWPPPRPSLARCRRCSGPLTTRLSRITRCAPVPQVKERRSFEEGRGHPVFFDFPQFALLYIQTLGREMETLAGVVNPLFYLTISHIYTYDFF